ncbi:hypothetical protein D3C77_499340 [compost metagenome]
MLAVVIVTPVCGTTAVRLHIPIAIDFYMNTVILSAPNHCCILQSFWIGIRIIQLHSSIMIIGIPLRIANLAAQQFDDPRRQLKAHSSVPSLEIKSHSQKFRTITNI